MTSQHIVSSFDRDLEALQARLMKMGDQVEKAISRALEALETRDLKLSEEVRQGDRVIDAMDEEIKAEAARVLALRAPAASDLRTVLSVMNMCSHLERCGDYAKNIAKRTTVLIDTTSIGGTEPALRRMAHMVEQMLADALEAYIQRDAAKAMEVRDRDLEVDQMYNTLFRALLTHMMEDPRNITACMHLHFIAKNIERMGDHATSIAEQTIYLVTGEMPDENRPKGDTTAYNPQGNLAT
ncbi:phosphate uptake regulator, PhoU [Salinihabitans flavidus]|uniref:Phosphate-specific transport system accessory protein PhoU n=1 Tax=Salinihabitans flavidus TaxID=569882 RepID=A0A1H8VPV7_9RHOB|nr:phosphate signaling complex protein PhoU [Salinihabitans flavidus]SEP17409.1 phosphate uptake regulator, PhoU [Salinihabitans flavidus]